MNLTVGLDIKWVRLALLQVCKESDWPVIVAIVDVTAKSKDPLRVPALILTAFGRRLSRKIIESLDVELVCEI